MIEPLVRVQNLSFSYTVDDRKIEILRNLDFTIEPGEFTAIQGPSGSGKSTFFYLLGCLLKPTQGQVFFGGREITSMSQDELAIFRNQHVGFVFQQFHLLPRASVFENILLPTLYPSEWADQSPEARARSREKAIGLARRLGLEDQLEKQPNQLSGGQQQRVAIARALMNDTQLILADEPTGNLDSKSAAQILELFRELNREGKTIVLITHDSEVAGKCDRVHHFKDGVFVRTEDRREKGAPISARRPFAAQREPKVWSGLGGETVGLLRSVLPLAAENLIRNKTKSMLTLLGVVIGVSAVTAMVTLGQFAKKKILEGYEQLGVNTVTLYGYPNWKLRASDIVPFRFIDFDWKRDLAGLPDVFPAIRRMSPVMQDQGNNTLTASGVSLDSDVELVGVGQQYFGIVDRKLLKGSPMSESHVEFHSPVCWLGFGLAKRLFDSADPLGQIVTVSSGDKNLAPCRVAGVLEHLETNQDRHPPDQQIFVPYTFFQTVTNSWWASGIHNMLIQLKSGSDVEKTGAGFQKYYEQRYGKGGQFVISNDSKLLAQMRSFLNIFTLLLTSIAALSLVVGGIGINNMMLVSITERLKEFGLRKSLGATHRSLRFQMLVESCLLCVVAGIAGVIIGVAGYEILIFVGSQLIPKLKFEWLIEPWAIVLSVGAIAAVGVLSGIAPAVRAEKLEVIEALRSE